MVTFRNNNNSNNNRRTSFRRNTRNFKSNGDNNKFNNFSTNENFKRKAPGRNNHNAPKLIEKYNDLAREALSNGDKILSENYLQHADHFTRILNEKENLKKDRNLENQNQNINDKISETTIENTNISKNDNLEKSQENIETKKDTKSLSEVN